MFKPKRGKKGVFGTIDNVAQKYSISREGEVHTKIVDVPSPFDGTFRIDDELEPSRYLFMEFKEIHDSYYIGINKIEFYDAAGKAVPFKNIAVDGEHGQSAMPPKGWWAVGGKYHSLLFDFEKVVHIESVYVWCANSASTPKYIHISDAEEPAPDHVSAPQFANDLYIQLAGEPMTPVNIKFRECPAVKTVVLSCDEIIARLNDKPPKKDRFETYMSEDGKSLFAFYQAGHRTRACNYFFGREPNAAVQLVNSVVPTTGVTIDDVATRAMTLEELRAVRAIIVSDCVKNKWKSSRSGQMLLPGDVNLYDLNAILIKPLTKKRNCAFKELFGTGTAPPTYYVSHWWGESVLDFILCCEYHAMMYGLEASETSYWVCAYANRQHDLGADLGKDPAKSSFNRAMGLARGVYLVIDEHVTATSRIWVDYELFRSVESKSSIDIGIYHDGAVRMIADTAIPNETPYQRNRREMKFPFAQVCAMFLTIQLHKGEVSQQIDKIRIINSMCGHTDNLDDKGVLERIESADKSDAMYVKEKGILARSDWTLRAEMAQKSLSIALSTEGETIENFHGNNLVEIINRDTRRTVLSFDDMTSLPGVDDGVFATIVGMIGPNIDTFLLNVAGCPNLTNACINKLMLPETLKNLDLNLGHARNITNDALIKLANAIPANLETLVLSVTGYKNPDGTYLPLRHNDHLEAFAAAMPQNLSEYSLTTTLGGEETSEGLIELAKSMPGGLKKFHLFIRWDGFTGDCLETIVGYLPTSLEHLSLKFHMGEYIELDALTLLAAECERLVNLQSLVLSSRDGGRKGYYGCRDIGSLQELKDIVVPM